MSRGHGAESLRAVLDTNIYIAAFESPNGRNAALWRAAIEGHYRLIVSSAIIRETAKVLRANFGWREDRIQKVIRRIADVAGDGVVIPRASVHAVTIDPDDNRILECAVDGKADIIVSNDHHLLDLGGWAGIPVVAGADFRRMLELK